jgi:putative colanic acid biosynthesis acetyltransferase WcaB
MYLLQDWTKGNSLKGKVITFLFRLASLGNINFFLKISLLPYLIFYKFFVEWILGIELPYNAKIGKGLKIFHGQALVISSNVTIGVNCILRQSTTIGNANLDPNGLCPIIGNNVQIGSNCCIIGNITIGDNVTIGAGSVIVKNIPSNCVIVGNPGRIIKRI